MMRTYTFLITSLWILGSCSILAGCGSPSQNPTATPILDEDSDGWNGQADCNDDQPEVHPGQPEVCNGIDDNCDGIVDEPAAQDAKIWYRDADGDTFGQEHSDVRACNKPDGPYFEIDGGDCNDTRADIYPGAEDACGDGVDSDCDDEDPPCPTPTPAIEPDSSPTPTDPCENADPPCPTPTSTPAVDNDDDGYSPPADCNDEDAYIHPGALDVCGNGVDSDCAGGLDTCVTEIVLVSATLDGSFQVSLLAPATGIATEIGFVEGLYALPSAGGAVEIENNRLLEAGLDSAGQWRLTSTALGEDSNPDEEMLDTAIETSAEASIQALRSVPGLGTLTLRRTAGGLDLAWLDPAKGGFTSLSSITGPLFMIPETFTIDPLRRQARLILVRGVASTPSLVTWGLESGSIQVEATVAKTPLACLPYSEGPLYCLFSDLAGLYLASIDPANGDISPRVDLSLEHLTPGCLAWDELTHRILMCGQSLEGLSLLEIYEPDTFRHLDVPLSGDAVPIQLMTW